MNKKECKEPCITNYLSDRVCSKCADKAIRVLSLDEDVLNQMKGNFGDKFLHLKDNGDGTSTVMFKNKP